MALTLFFTWQPNWIFSQILWQYVKQTTDYSDKDNMTQLEI